MNTGAVLLTKKEEATILRFRDGTVTKDDLAALRALMAKGLVGLTESGKEIAQMVGAT